MCSEQTKLSEEQQKQVDEINLLFEKCNEAQQRFESFKKLKKSLFEDEESAD